MLEIVEQLQKYGVIESTLDLMQQLKKIAG